MSDGEIETIGDQELGPSAPGNVVPPNSNSWREQLGAKLDPESDDYDPELASTAKAALETAQRNIQNLISGPASTIMNGPLAKLVEQQQRLGEMFRFDQFRITPFPKFEFPKGPDFAGVEETFAAAARRKAEVGNATIEASERLERIGLVLNSQNETIAGMAHYIAESDRIKSLAQQERDADQRRQHQENMRWTRLVAAVTIIGLAVAVYSLFQTSRAPVIEVRVDAAALTPVLEPLQQRIQTLEAQLRVARANKQFQRGTSSRVRRESAPRSRER